LERAIPAFLIVALGCQRPSDELPKIAMAPTESLPKMAIVHPERKTVRLAIRRPGYDVQPYQSTAIYSRISGLVGKWTVDIGDRVKKNDVMATLSVPDLDVEVLQKNAAMLQADAEIGQAKAAVVRAQAELDRAKSQYDRMTKAGKGGVIGKEDVDETRFGFEAAKAGLAKAEADVRVAEARLEVARKARDYAATQVGFAKIVAPFDGVVSQRNLNDGDLVQPGMNRSAKPLFVVDQVDRMRIVVNIPESEAAWVRDGSQAVVRGQGLGGRELKGTVTRNAGSLNPATRTLRIEIQLPNPDAALLPGMYVEVTIAAERRDVWALPTSALAADLNPSIGYRIVDGKTVRTPLRIGLRGDGLVEVLKEQAAPASSDADGAWQDLDGTETFVAVVGPQTKVGQAVSAAADQKK
jgi:RND family efflux transporter MFP subunit